jgi:hypothetical protein
VVERKLSHGSPLDPKNKINKKKKKKEKKKRKKRCFILDQL